MRPASPRLAVVATGGTILGASRPEGGYTAGVLSAAGWLHTLPHTIPGLDFEVSTPFSMDSAHLEPAHWLKLAHWVHPLLQRADLDGIVILHGTDTLEETALCLASLLPRTKPVVLTAAMRPADHPEADGPANLQDALCAALDPRAAAWGPVLAMQGKLYAAQGLMKHNLSLDAFAGSPLLGKVHPEAHCVDWLAPAPAAITLPIPIPPSLPPVALVSVYPGMPAEMLEMALSQAAGLVLIGLGAGTFPPEIVAVVARGIQAGKRIVCASRVPHGVVRVADLPAGCVSAGTLSPQQARVALMLQLSQNLAPHSLGG